MIPFLKPHVACSNTVSYTLSAYCCGKKVSSVSLHSNTFYSAAKPLFSQLKYYIQQSWLWWVKGTAVCSVERLCLFNFVPFYLDWARPIEHNFIWTLQTEEDATCLEPSHETWRVADTNRIYLMAISFKLKPLKEAEPSIYFHFLRLIQLLFKEKSCFGQSNEVTR